MAGRNVIARGFQKNRGAYRIDAAVAYEPKTIAQLAKEGKVTQLHVKKHCDFWIKDAKFYGKTEDGRFFRRRTGPQPGGR